MRAVLVTSSKVRKKEPGLFDSKSHYTEQVESLAALQEGGFQFLMEKDKNFVIPPEEMQATDNEIYTSSDPNFWDYVRQKDITKNSGIEPNNFHSFIIKELLDNAADFLERNHIDGIIIVHAIRNRDSFQISVRNSNPNNIPVFTNLIETFNFKRAYSSQSNQYCVTRGAQGDAIKKMSTMWYALDNKWNEPLIIRHNKKVEKIYLQVNRKQGIGSYDFRAILNTFLYHHILQHLQISCLFLSCPNMPVSIKTNHLSYRSISKRLRVIRVLPPLVSNSKFRLWCYHVQLNPQILLVFSSPNNVTYIGIAKTTPQPKLAGDSTNVIFNSTAKLSEFLTLLLDRP